MHSDIVPAHEAIADGEATAWSAD